MAVEHVLQPVLDDEDGAPLLPGELVDDLHRLQPRLRIQSGQRLVKDEDVHRLAQDAGDGHLLLLSAGEVEGNRAQKVLHPHYTGKFLHPWHHLRPGHVVVFHGEGDVLAHRQAHKLGVAVLENGAHRFAQLKDRAFPGLHPVDLHRAGDGALVGEGNEAVDTAGQGGFAAA